jgi:ABC-type transport system involved in multi-copper enzyme maturation permease subunit
MTAVAEETVRRARAAVEPVPLRRVAAVELRKMFDTRSGFWLMASIVMAEIIATGAVILFADDRDLNYATFGAAIGYPMAVILPLIALLSVTSEWSQRSGLTTFTLVPQRSRVILAKAGCAVGVGVASMLVAFAVGALGNIVGSTVRGITPVWDVSFADAALIVLANVLGLLTGFMLGVVIRNSAGAITAYFAYSFVLTTLSGLLAQSQHWWANLRPWVDVNFAQAALFDGPLTGEQWANVGVTGLIWLVIPLAIGLRIVLQSEIK